MEQRGGLRGAVARLAIVAHGDRDGVVELDPPLTLSTVGRYGSNFDRLRLFLTRNAFLEIYSCVAGAGEDGSRLLNEISVRLPGRTVVGFIVSGETQANEALSRMSPQTPGHIREAPHSLGTGRSGRTGLLTPWSFYAKWSRNGRVVRMPILGRDRDNRCANPECPGHASAVDNCEGWDNEL